MVNKPLVFGPLKLCCMDFVDVGCSKLGIPIHLPQLVSQIRIHQSNKVKYLDKKFMCIFMAPYCFVKYAQTNLKGGAISSFAQDHYLLNFYINAKMIKFSV